MAADQAAVCDASVIAAITFGEPDSGTALSLVRSRRLLAPALLRYEMAQVAVRKCAQHPAGASQILQALAASLRLPIRMLEPSWLKVIELARAEGLSAYDSSYLLLAVELDVPLATLDARLGRAADKLGLRAR
jgi:predicted nucleic acid-binding protein